VDYSKFYKFEIAPDDPIDPTYDIFLSGFNQNERVINVFGRVNARQKVWVVQDEYALEESESPEDGDVYRCFHRDDWELCSDLLAQTGIWCGHVRTVCVDVTGFISSRMMCLLRMLSEVNGLKVDCLYSEPRSYIHRGETTFSKGGIEGVRQVVGFDGTFSRDSSNDLLIIGVGYDDRLISEVAQYKESAKKVLMFGFPSLRADMYQQSRVRAQRAENALGEIPRRWQHFAPANDPFVTASVLQDIVEGAAAIGTISNLYLSPLGTKAQVLGFVVFFLYENNRRDMSMIFPYSSEYGRLTDEGISRTWRFVMEFP
jgi:hypothetical protein